MTSTPAAVVRAVTVRDGKVCAMCGGTGDTLVPHHRANRGMGGSKLLDRVSNVVWLCSVENGLIESDAAWAAEARARGVKISRHSTPSREPILHAGFGGWVLLSDDGAAVAVDTPA